jgi:hypothetical protein
MARRRGVAESVGVAAIFASFVAFWRHVRSLVLLFVDAISIEDMRSRMFLRSELVLTKELPPQRVCKLVRGCCTVGNLL